MDGEEGALRIGQHGNPIASRNLHWPNYDLRAQCGGASGRGVGAVGDLDIVQPVRSRRFGPRASHPSTPFGTSEGAGLGSLAFGRGRPYT